MTVLASSNGELLAQPGTVAFLIVFGMGVMLFFVFRSMARHLRKVNDQARAEAEQAARESEPDEMAVPESAEAQASQRSDLNWH